MNKIVLLLLLGTISCVQVGKTVAQDSVSVIEQRTNVGLLDTLPSCRDKKYTVAKVYDSELDGKLVKRKQDGWLYIDCPTLYNSVLLRACNLPEDAYKEGSTIKFKGRLLTYRAIEMANLYARPFEVTTIRIVSQ